MKTEYGRNVMRSKREVAEIFVKEYKKRLEVEEEIKKEWDRLFALYEKNDEYDPEIGIQVDAAYKAYKEAQENTNIYARHALKGIFEAVEEERGKSDVSGRKNRAAVKSGSGVKANG